MARRTNPFHIDLAAAGLERRDLLSRAGAPAPAVHVERMSARQFLPSHRVILAGYEFNSPLLRLTRDRISASANSTSRLSKAFQVFAQNALHVPKGSVPIGNAPVPPTLAGSLAKLDQEVVQALKVLEPTTARLQPSVAKGPFVAPQVDQALIPYARGQLAQLASAYFANPPTFAADGSPTSGEPLALLNATYNRILNAVAENSVHPELFVSPTDYYVNPQSNFTISYNQAPAQGAPGYFVHGPGGVPLTGTLLPHQRG